MSAPESAPGVLALLGPTNTGKTHRAVERMLEHHTGMIGLPLRLLAREIYDRVTARVGERVVALVTGEEKRVPTHPRYWVCTVEAMPLSHTVDFLAVDEVQLGTHAQRGHVFTDRLLSARGRQETWFLGSEAVRSLVEDLVPTAKLKTHPRLSHLHGAPPVRLSHLPPRSAVVAFTADRVYEIADRIRHRRGGAAIVLGALSPRTRNAQVALFQSGEVDYMVATDAIGMGLNLDIHHVALADLQKFDGREERPLEPLELGQIVGRAGRYLRDGTFGVLSPRPPLPTGLVRALEQHRFPAERQLVWRNSALDLGSPAALIRSLSQPPPSRRLRRVERAEDQESLLVLAQRPEILERACTPERVALLWEVCQIPDYRQLLFELHVRELCEIYLQLTGPTEQLDPDWISDRLQRIDDARGDIPTLMAKIAEIRTFTYVANRPRWVARADELRARTSAIEDRLSDALHEGLVARFVERHRRVSLPSSNAGPAKGSPHPFQPLLALLGQLNGAQTPGPDPTQSIEAWVEAPHEQFCVDIQGNVLAEGQTLARLSRGVDLCRPEVLLRLALDPGAGARSRLQRRLLAFSRDWVASLLAPLRAPAITKLSAAGRGLVYQLEQGLGTTERAPASEQLALLSQRDLQLLTSLGVHLGSRYLYLPRLLTGPALAQRSILVGIFFSVRWPASLDALDQRCLKSERAVDPAITIPLGFASFGDISIRVDDLERILAIGSRSQKLPSALRCAALAQRLGCTEPVAAHLVETLADAGLIPRPTSGGPHTRRRSKHRHRPGSERR